ncbi:MAG: GNAT family N-acetyltransferase [Spirochaetes bacterium]|nr:GNAT family N-acetyltransferase [Spirochaetota bacterium]
MTWKPVTTAEWNDLVELFGPRGACAGCWCMWWRLSRRDFTRLKGDGTRRALKRLVTRGPAPGILAYDGDRPVGWCCVGPREDFPLLERSRVLARVDDESVWSIVCFFVARDRRRKGLTRRLVAAAVAYAGSRGARVIEAYPTDPGTDQPDAFVYTGLLSAFTSKGFVEVARRSKRRPILRKRITRRAARPAARSGRRPRPPR